MERNHKAQILLYKGRGEINKVAPAITPTLGAELLSNPSFDANTTGWAGSNCSLASVAGGQANNCMQLTRTGGSAQDGYATFSATVDEWYLYSAWVKSGTSGDESAALAAQMNDGTFSLLFSNTAPSTGTWVQRFLSWRATNAAMRFNLRKISATDGTMLYDTASNKQSTFSSMLAYLGNISRKNGTYQCTPTVALGTQAGIVLEYLDASNFVMLIVDRGGYTMQNTAQLVSRIAGTYAVARTGAITYGAAKILKAVVNGTTHQLFYDGTQVGADVTIDNSGMGTKVYGFTGYSGNAVGTVQTSP